MELAVSGVKPARMLTPGAVTSGLTMSRTGPGPRAENVAITFPVSGSVSSRLFSSTAATSLPASISATMRLPSAWPIMTAGMSTMDESPLMTMGSPAIL